MADDALIREVRLALLADLDDLHDEIDGVTLPTSMVGQRTTIHTQTQVRDWLRTITKLVEADTFDEHVDPERSDDRD
jgi:hypothetical protein